MISFAMNFIIRVNKHATLRKSESKLTDYLSHLVLSDDTVSGWIALILNSQIIW